MKAKLRKVYKRSFQALSIILTGTLLSLGPLLSGCATTGAVRFSIGALAGGITGAGGGAALSPNSESRALNALVFGLTGGLIGGGIAILSDPGVDSTTPASLKERELQTQRKLYPLNASPSTSEDLPDFVKKRLSPVVIEEYQERPKVSEEGTLHEPHRAYRIQRPAELSPHPLNSKAPQMENGEQIQ